MPEVVDHPDACLCGWCHCGCGLRPVNDRGRNPRYCIGHRLRSGGRYIDERGYANVKRHGHPHARARGYVYEHVLVASAALGHALPRGAVVHHVNGNKGDNRPSNLVVCQSQAYHLLLEMRDRAIAASGRPDWRLCNFCGEYDNPDAMYLHPTQTRAYHRECLTQSRANRAA